MKKIIALLISLGIVGMALAVPNTGAPLYDRDRNPVSLAADTTDTLKAEVRWLICDSLGNLYITGSVGITDTVLAQIVDTVLTQVVDTVNVTVTNPITTNPNRLYPYFTSGFMDSTDVDTLYLFPLPVVSFWIQNMSSTDTLRLSWLGTAFPASYISILPNASFGLENIWRPDSLNGLYLAGSADSIPWELVVLSDSLYIP